ncbi:hypothetical protein [Escherichia coli]
MAAIIFMAVLYLENHS